MPWQPLVGNPAVSLVTLDEDTTLLYLSKAAQRYAWVGDRHGPDGWKSGRMMCRCAAVRDQTLRAAAEAFQGTSPFHSEAEWQPPVATATPVLVIEEVGSHRLKETPDSEPRRITLRIGRRHSGRPVSSHLAAVHFLGR
jgi:hypothetical protein